MFIFALPFFSFGIGSLFTLMMSMTADVIDLDELNYGIRREGVFGAIYWWMVKFGFAIAGGLSGIILSLVGFSAEALPGPIPIGEVWPGITGLRIFFSGLPIAGTFIAILVMLKYDIDEERANEIRAELEHRKTAKQEIPAYLAQKEKLLSLTKVEVTKLASRVDFSATSPGKIQSMFLDSLKQGVHGMCFSPYAEGQNIGDQLSRDQIERRMDLIAPYTRWVRSFSCTDGNEFIPEVAKARGVKTVVGAWIDSDRENNAREIENLIKLAKAGYVDIAVVGNEVILRGELPVGDIVAYLKQVKEALPHIQVAYADTYYELLQHPVLIQNSDVVCANCYPFWEGYNIEHASGYLEHMYRLIKKEAAGKTVLVSETGWPTAGSNVNEAVPGLGNMMKYFVNLNKWSVEEDIELFYFSSFDESWKVRHEGDVGARWGIWDKNEKLKS
jgi:GPH family glycoside/pentoside/hexuronide:cation symporter